MSLFDWSNSNPWTTLLNQDNVVIRVHDRHDITDIFPDPDPKPAELEIEVFHTRDETSKAAARAHLTKFRVTAEEWHTMRDAIDEQFTLADQRRAERKARANKERTEPVS